MHNGITKSKNCSVSPSFYLPGFFRKRRTSRLPVVGAGKRKSCGAKKRRSGSSWRRRRSSSGSRLTRRPRAVSNSGWQTFWKSNASRTSPWLRPKRCARAGILTFVLAQPTRARILLWVRECQLSVSVTGGRRRTKKGGGTKKESSQALV